MLYQLFFTFLCTCGYCFVSKYVCDLCCDDLSQCAVIPEMNGMPVPSVTVKVSAAHLTLMSIKYITFSCLIEACSAFYC